MKRLFSAFLRLVCFVFAGACLLILPGLEDRAAAVSVLQSIEAALHYNPELKSSQEARQLSFHAVEQAKAGYMPNVSLSAGGGMSRRSDSNTRERNEDSTFRSIMDADLTLTQPLFHGFAITENVKRAAAEFASSDNVLEDRGIAIIYSAIMAHADVVRRIELVALARANVEAHAKILESVKNRYDNGVSTTGELNQVLSRHARAKATLMAYETALDSARANYLRVTGNIAKNLEKLHAPSRLFTSLEDLRNATLRSNPSIKSSLAVLKAAVHEKGTAQSRFYPQLDLVVGPTWSDRDSKVDSRVSDLSAEVRLSWELFSGGDNMATVRMVNAKIRQARQNLHALMNFLNEDIESTFSRYQAANIEAREYRRAKVASRNAQQDYYRQFHEAKRSLIDVLDAENDFFYAASQEVMSKSDRLLAAYRLLALSGDILSEFRIDSSRLRVDTPTTATEPVNDFTKVPSPLTGGWANSMAR